MKLKAAAAAAICALVAASVASVGATTPPSSEPTTTAPTTTEATTTSSSSTSSTTTIASTTEVTTTVTIVVDPTTPGESSTVPTGTFAAAAVTSQAADVGTSAPVESDQDQTAVVTATVVADANSGGNLATTDSSGGGSSLPAEIASGDATAVGSSDENVVTQGADVVLTDSATANLLQLALVINVGAAFANSGLNAISASGAPGVSGEISTGDATATGLDIEQYITQAARHDAGTGEDAESSQLAISLWMGLATATTGANAVAGTGVAAGGGSIGSGAASATGNDSHTEIGQYAEILGVDQSTVNVTQRATVLNLGFALANTGLNDVSSVASGLLTASASDDDAVAQQLFAMLLPAMLQSYGYGPAQGSIATGSATAVGNQSDTFVRQVALAAASGNGQVDIVQDVIVANMGAAAASSGGNSLGSVRTLDEETANAVVTMSAFMAELLSIVHQSAGSTVLSAQRQGIEVPFQGLLLRLDGSIQGLDTQLASGGAQANVRQVSVIVSLGLAEANTGGNATESQADVQQGTRVNALRAGDAIAVLAVDANGNVITTGDAVAGNQDVVVVCQRINADDVDCLAPPTTTVPEAPPTTVVGGTPISVAAPETTTPGGTDPQAPTTAAAPSPNGVANRPPPVEVPVGMLPATGRGSVDVAVVGLASLLVGSMLLLVTRRRTSP